MNERRIMWGVKGALAASLLVGLVFPDIPGVAGKGWPERCLGYPLSALVVPILWRLNSRRRSRNGNQARPYPHLADALLVTPFLLDHFHTATGGESLRVNIRVVERNAALAADIAVARTTSRRA